MAEDGCVELMDAGKFISEVNPITEADDFDKKDDGALSENERESDAIESSNNKEIEQLSNENLNNVGENEFQNKESSMPLNSQLKEPVINESEVQESNADSEGELVSNSSGSSSPMYNEIQSDIDEHLADLYSQLYTQRYSMDNLFLNFRDLIELICLNINTDNSEEETNFFAGFDSITQQLEDFHPQANSVFEQLSSVLNDLIAKIETEAETGDTESCEWANNLRIFTQSFREAFYCIPSTFQPNFLNFSPLYAAVDSDMGYPPRSTNYRYLTNLPWPVMPTSFYVPPVMKTEKVITGLPMLNDRSHAVYRSESNILPDINYLPSRNLTAEAAASSSPGQEFAANPSASMLSVISTVVSESDQNLATSVPSLSNVTSGHPSNTIFATANPFGPNRVDNPSNFGLPSAFPRPQQSLSFGSTSVQNFVRPIAAPSSVTPAAQRIPSLLDIQVAPPTSIFKRPSEANPPPTKRAKTTIQNRPLKQIQMYSQIYSTGGVFVQPAIYFSGNDNNMTYYSHPVSPGMNPSMGSAMPYYNTPPLSMGGGISPIPSAAMGEGPAQMRKLFIGGLNHETTDEQLREYYSQWGLVVDCIVIRDPVTKHSRGFGFVTYATIQMAETAMNNRPHTINGKVVDPKRAIPREQMLPMTANNPPYFLEVEPQQDCKIVLSGIHWDFHTVDGLRQHFEQFGSVEQVEILGHPRGFGFVVFEDKEAVARCKTFGKSHTVNGKKVEIKSDSIELPSTSMVYSKRRHNLNKNPSINLATPESFFSDYSSSGSFQSDHSDIKTCSAIS